MNEAIAAADGVPCSDLLAQFAITAPTMSHHLKELETAGLITGEREGKFIRLHFTRPLSRAHLARLAGLSLSQFHQVFTRSTGLTPLGYLHAERARMAVDLLADRRLLLAEIASRVGYGDEFHFSRRFKAETGLSPRAYRTYWLVAGERP